MKLLLINPPIEKNVYSKYQFSSPVLPPLGLLSIGAVIKKNKDSVSLLDCPAKNKNWSQTVDIIKKERPDVVCLTSSTATWNITKKIINQLKNFDRGIITILGGPHISVLPEKTMQECPGLDYGCIGESEITIEELLQAIKNNLQPDYIKGIIYRKKNSIIINKERKIVERLDDLPIPAFELIESIKEYSHTPFRAIGRSFPLVTSRGCSYGCFFCDQGVFSNKWRAYGPKKVIKMIRAVQKRFKINFISFEDDDFAIDKKRVIDICKLIIKNKIKIRWGCSLHIKDIDQEMIKWMKSAGCWNIYTGIESGSQRVLRYINKQTEIKEIKKNIKLIKKYKINVYGSFIIGFPTETKKEIEKTIKLAMKLPLDGVSFFTYTPYPKTVLYNEVIKKQKLPNDWKRYSSHNNDPIIVNKTLNKKYLLKKQRDAYLAFYLRPTYIIKHINRVININYLKKVFVFIYKFKLFQKDNSKRLEKFSKLK